MVDGGVVRAIVLEVGKIWDYFKTLIDEGSIQQQLRDETFPLQTRTLLRYNNIRRTVAVDSPTNSKEDEKRRKKEKKKKKKRADEEEATKKSPWQELRMDVFVSK